MSRVVDSVAGVGQAVVVDEGEGREECFPGNAAGQAFALLSTLETDAVDDEDADQAMKLILKIFLSNKI